MIWYKYLQSTSSTKNKTKEKGKVITVYLLRAEIISTTYMYLYNICIYIKKRMKKKKTFPENFFCK